MCLSLEKKQPLLAAVGLLVASAAVLAAAAPASKPSIAQALAELKVPPPWLDAVPLDVDPSSPWNQAWDRIEELLMTADPADRRKAVKLACGHFTAEVFGYSETIRAAGRCGTRGSRA